MRVQGREVRGGRKQEGVHSLSLCFRPQRHLVVGFREHSPRGLIECVRFHQEKFVRSEMPPMAGLGSLLLDGSPTQPAAGPQREPATAHERKESRVGREFQATIPAVGERSVAAGATARDNSRLIWSPR